MHLLFSLTWHNILTALPCFLYLDESTSVGLCGLHRDYKYRDDGKESSKRMRQPWLVKISVQVSSFHVKISQ